MTTKELKQIESGLMAQGVNPLLLYKAVDPTKPTKVIPGILKEHQAFLVEAIIIHYAEYHNYPTPRELHEYSKKTVPLALCHRVWKVQPFLEVLYSRGLPAVESLTVRREDPHVVTSIALSEALEPRQLLALSVMTDTTQRLTLETRLRRAGISKSEWQNWMRNKKFRAKFENIARETFIRSQSMIDLQLASGALEGKLDFIKYYNEVSGRHDPNKQAKVEVRAVLAAVVEIITRNVTDPETLNRISSEMQLQLQALDL